MKIYKVLIVTGLKEDKMTSKCVYCKTELTDGRAVDVCTPCGRGIWGEKMFQAIISNMGTARDKGDLYQGSVTSLKPSQGSTEAF